MTRVIEGLPHIMRLKLSSAEDAAVGRALRARENAYAPYSRYKVGAAVVSKKGNIYVGVNAENHIFVVPHAEMNACAAMIAEGEYEFTTLVCAAENGGIPCGFCLQATREWAGRDLSKVIVVGVGIRDPYTVIRCTFAEAMQVVDAFGPEHMETAFPGIAAYRPHA